MKYLSNDHYITIEASGGFKLLEKIGFKSEQTIEVERRKTAKREKDQAFFDEIKAKDVIGYREARANKPV